MEKGERKGRGIIRHWVHQQLTKREQGAATSAKGLEEGGQAPRD